MQRKQTSQQEKWETIFRRFDPERPPTESGWHVPRAQRSIRNILKALDRPHAPPRFLLPGTIGTGKTTELRRIAEERANLEFVVVLDLERHFDEVVGDQPALRNVSTWEVCFLVAFYTLRQAKAILGYDLPKDHLNSLETNWARLAQITSESAVPPVVDLAKLLSAGLTTASVVAPAIAPMTAPAAPFMKAAAGLLGTMKWPASMGRATKNVNDQDIVVQSLLTSINIALQLVASACPEQRVLVIVDGLDKIHDVDRAAELFIRSNLIAQLDCCLIVACPFALRHHVAIGSSLSFTSVPPLMNEPVMRQDEPSQKGSGIAFFLELFERRVKDLGEPASFISRPHLEKLAYYSGGRARDFVKFIRVLSELAWDANIVTATEAIVDEALDNMRRERELGIHRGHIELLRTVMADHERRLPNAPLTPELLRFSLLLPYSNGSEWYYPHPLLLIHLLPTVTGGSSASSGTSP